jgi:hypothetical protein
MISTIQTRLDRRRAPRGPASNATVMASIDAPAWINGSMSCPISDGPRGNDLLAV